MVKKNGSAVWIQPYNDVPKMIRVFNNTVLAADTGIKVSCGDPAFSQLVIGNAVFAGTPLNNSGGGAQQADNVTGAFASAGNDLANPGGSPTGCP